MLELLRSGFHARKDRSYFRHCGRPNHRLTSCSVGMESSKRKSFSKISMLFSTPRGGQFSRAPSFVKEKQKNASKKWEFTSVGCDIPFCYLVRSRMISMVETFRAS